MPNSENILLNTYDQVYARTSDELVASTAVVADLSLREIKTGYSEISDQYFDGLFDRDVVEFDIEHNRQLSELTDTDQFVNRRRQAMLGEELVAVLERTDLAEQDMGKARQVKDRQHQLGRRITSILVAGGFIVGAIGMETLDVVAQRNASEFVQQEDGQKVPVYTHRPIDVFVDGIAAASGAEVGFFASMYLAPRSAKRRAKKIMRNSGQHN